MKMTQDIWLSLTNVLLLYVPYDAPLLGSQCTHLCAAAKLQLLYVTADGL